MMALLRKYEVDVNVQDDAGMTPIMWAACFNRHNHVERLVKLGADLLEKDIDGKTAMDWWVCSIPIDYRSIFLHLTTANPPMFPVLAGLGRCTRTARRACE